LDIAGDEEDADVGVEFLNLALEDNDLALWTQVYFALDSKDILYERMEFFVSWL